MKKLWIFMSPKGGVGKTMAACVALEYVRKSKKRDGSDYRVIAVDCDDSSPRFSNFYGLKKDGRYDLTINKASPSGVRRVNFRNEDDAEGLVDIKRIECDMVLLDLPGGAMGFEHILDNNSQFVNFYKKSGFDQITLFFVINQEKECAERVKSVIKSWGVKENGIEFVVVKSGGNLKDDNDFMFFDGVNADELDYPADEVEAVGGKMLRLPYLRNKHYNYIPAREIQLSKIDPDDDKVLEKIPTVPATMIHSWLNQLYEEFESVVPLK